MNAPSLDLLAKFGPTRDALSLVSGVANPPFRTRIERVLSPGEVQIGGRRVLMLGSNNYLGLTMDPEVGAAAIAATQEMGVGTTGSRMANGNFAVHEALEHELAAFLGRRHAMITTTGAQANLAAIATLAGPQDILLLDADNHATVWDAARLSGAQIVRFRHNDPDDLAKRLARLDGAARNKLVVVEGCYSMTGAIAPLDRFVEVKDAHNAYLLVDEAHSVGVFGPSGQGVAAMQGVADRVDFTTGTFSKSLAGIGGFCVSDHDVLPLLHYSARAYMFTASPNPASVASVRAALARLQADPSLRTRLFANAARLRTGLINQGWDVVDGQGPITALRVGGPEVAVQTWSALLDAGIYTNLFLPPAVPRDGCLLRTSVTAAHTDALIDEALEVMARARTPRG